MSLKSYIVSRVRYGAQKKKGVAPEAELEQANLTPDLLAKTTVPESAVPESAVPKATNEPRNYFARESGAMTATAITLEDNASADQADALGRTWDYRSPHEGGPEAASAPLPPTIEANGMRFTYASGSKPLSGYTIKRGVGVGGFGEVYFALSDAGKEVALKRVQRNLEIELRGVSHCLNLKHPNLISLFDIRYDDSGQAWIVMEYVAGNSLRTALDRAPHGLDEREVRRWFAALAAGVAHLHEAGIVHRDLKPGNIFDDDGIVKIGDYGLSKYISCSRKGGHTESVGTFHYMAPEVGRGNYGREIDIYAMGIILFELLTGTVPFDGESSHEIVMKHLTANPDLSAVSEPYRSVIWQALQKNPAARQQTVSQMLRPLGIELDEHGLARALQGSISDPFIGRVVDPVVADPGIQFGPMFGESAAAAIPQPNTRNAGPEIRFGEVRYHRPDGQNPPGAHGFVAAYAALPTTGRAPEPIARAVRSTSADLRRWWSSLEPFPGTRLVLLIMGLALLVLNTHWLLPLLTVLAAIYVPYYILRAMILGVSRQPSYAEAHQLAVAQQQLLNRQQRPRTIPVKQWRERKRIELAAKRSSLRLAELGSSMTSGVFVTVVLVGVGYWMNTWEQGWSAVALAPFVWSAAVAILGTLGILLLGKLWEREAKAGIGRRLVMAGTGAAVGAAAFALANYLMVPLGQDLGREFDGLALSDALYDTSGSPRIAALMAHFAVLFAALRWWRSADPLRNRRFSVWATAVAVVGGWALHQFLPVPQPWGLITAGLMSIAVQFAAPWENPKQRFEEAVPQQPQIV